MNIRLDYVFSYWIFAWFLLYYFKLVSFNPLFALILATIENTMLLLLMIYYKVHIINIISFIVINFFIKVLPIIYLWKSKIILRDIIALVVLYLIYIVWLYINKQYNFLNIQMDIYNSLIHGKSETPFMALVAKLKPYIVKKDIHNLD